MNLASWCVLVVVVTALFFAVRASWRRRKQGCGGDCSRCQSICARQNKAFIARDCDRLNVRDCDTVDVRHPESKDIRKR